MYDVYKEILMMNKSNNRSWGFRPEVEYLLSESKTLGLVLYLKKKRKEYMNKVPWFGACVALSKFLSSDPITPIRQFTLSPEHSSHYTHKTVHTCDSSWSQYPHRQHSLTQTYTSK